MIKSVLRSFINLKDKSSKDKSSEKIELRSVLDSRLRVCCETCIYWISGKCRRHAPTSITGFRAAPRFPDFPCAVWPETAAADLCGEWAIVWRVDINN